MRRMRMFRFTAALGAATVVVGGLTLFAGVDIAAATPTATASCTFNGHANNSFIPGITPGGSISIACTGLPHSTNVVIAQASALAGIVSSNDAIDEADTSALKFVTSTSTGSLPAGTTFTVPTTFKADDPNAKCPPTTAQINAGLYGCAVAVAELTGTDFGDALLDYTGQPSPAAPTLSVSPTSSAAGDQVTLADGADTGNWWGDAYGPTSITSSDVTVGGLRAGATSATISGASYPITTKGKKTTYGPLTPPKLSGTFTVPCGLSGAQTVKVTEPNTTDIAGTISATTSLDVVPGTIPAVTSLSPTEGPDAGGTSVTISGCNFTHAKSVTFGTKAATSFHINNDNSITAVSPPGTGTVHVVVTSKKGSSSSTSAASEFTYGLAGYDLAAADGGTFAFGDALNYGSLPGLGVTPAAPIAGIAPTSDGKGYWLVGQDGGVYAFGDAKYYGSLPGIGVKPDGTIVGIARTDDDGGYWLVSSGGGVYAFGDAAYMGSLPGLGVTPAKPIVSIISPDSGGYQLVGADGGVYAFGDAKFYGSIPGLGKVPAMPVSGAASTGTGGYWMVGQDGGVYAFGDARYDGSLPGLNVTPAKPIVAIISPDTGGYQLVGADGGVFAFGDAKFFGSMGGRVLAAPVTSGGVA